MLGPSTRPLVPAELTIQRNTLTGLPSDLDLLDAENGSLSNAAMELDALFPNAGVLNREVRRYHERYKPRRNADLVFIRKDSA